MRDYVAIATQYIADVLDGTIPACKWVKRACERQRRDLARAEANDPAFPYVFNPPLLRKYGARAGKTYHPAVSICTFAELMPHIKGDWAARGERIRLDPWQVFFLTCVFGWVHRETGKRRFRKADLFVPRKNGKSTIAAVVGNYMLGADEEYGAEIYSGASSEKQANEVFRPARLMAIASPEFRSNFGVLPNVGSLVVLDTNSKFEKLIGKPGDGASPHLSITDEYHEHDTAEQYETMVTGMGARSQPLALVITTAGTNIGGPCYSHEREAGKILDGVIVDETRFCLIYGIDKTDDWRSEDALRKANPGFGVSVAKDFLLTALAEARRDTRKSSTYRTKHLNVWVGAASPWLNIERLLAAIDPALREKDFRGETCHLGLDLASKIDIAAKAKIFERTVKGEKHYYYFSRNWIPEARVQLDENEHYRGWAESGDLVQTPGNMIDLAYIQDEVEHESDLHVVAEVAFDPYGSMMMAPALTNEGFTCVDVPQRVAYLSEPMKMIAALIDADRFHVAANDCTVWQLSNVECVEDKNENVFPRKAKAELKIDAASALITAMARVIAAAPAPEYQVFFA